MDKLVFWALVLALFWAFFSPVVADLLGLGDWFLRADLLLGWAAFGLVFIRARKSSTEVRVLVVSVIAFGLLQLSTAAITGAPLLAVAASFAILAFPLAVLSVLLLAPPSPGQLRLLVQLLIGLAFLQIIVLLLQLPFSSAPEQNTGTFLGLKIGFHLCGAITGAAALWILGRFEGVRSALAAIPLLLGSVITETRQVAFLIPIALALSPALDWKRWIFRLAGPIVVLVLILLLPRVEGISNSPGSLATGQVEAIVSRPFESRKVQGFERTVELLLESPSSLLFGLGQGQSIGFLAMVGDRQLQDQLGPSVGESLGLGTSRVARDLGPRSGYGTITQEEFSSLGGLIGDLGLLGSAAFITALIAVSLMVSGVRGRIRGAVQALGIFFLAMGLIYIWWEQPAFTLYVALLIGAGILSAGSRSAANAEVS